MQNREFLVPGIASLLLAVLFPIYWGSVFGISFDNFETALISDLATFDLMDALFILIGALEVYIYVSLARLLNQNIHSTSSKVVLYLMAALVVLLHLTVVFDIYLALSNHVAAASTIETLAGISVFTAIGVLIAYSILGIILSVILLMKQSEGASLLKVFALLMIVMCVLQLTVVLSFMNIFLFPVALVVLAVHFLKEPELVEVV